MKPSPQGQNGCIKSHLLSFSPIFPLPLQPTCGPYGFETIFFPGTKHLSTLHLPSHSPPFFFFLLPPTWSWGSTGAFILSSWRFISNTCSTYSWCAMAVPIFCCLITCWGNEKPKGRSTSWFWNSYKRPSSWKKAQSDKTTKAVLCSSNAT